MNGNPEHDSPDQHNPERHNPERHNPGHDDPAALEATWRPVIERLDPFRVRDTDDGTERRSILTMFPYPSGDLHMGHGEVYAITDVLARYWFQRGHDVLHPIGWDAFGLPAENAAIRRGLHPAEWTYANIATQAESLHRYAGAFDWSRRFDTCDSSYYHWNQWLFLRMYERGLAYRRKAPVNWCPSCATVLANEQVVGGACERCDTAVVQRELTQWFLRITSYAQRLLDDMAGLADGWPEHVLTLQRNWIGRADGAHVEFTVDGRPEPVTVFTTRPDTLFGVTFLAVAPDTELAAQLCSPHRQAALSLYRKEISGRSTIERAAGKSGVFLGTHATNPVNGERVPVYAADYVLAGSGTGAVMGVPAHDQRDLEFAGTHELPVRVVVDAGQPRQPGAGGTAVPSDGVHVNSGFLDGLRVDDANERIIAWLTDNETGRGAVSYRLRDWLISRQRYWGTPIPIIHCGQCGEVAVPDDQLPVTLPDLRGADLAPHGVSPLAAADDWVAVTCPRCGGDARRDTDTMDTFVDSSWYFLRFCSPHESQAPFDAAAVARWCPIDQYVGEATYATSHLLYARFMTKVLHDLGLVSFTEPFARLLCQGQVTYRGKRMSKSRGNMVQLSEQIAEYGVDAVRLTMVFAGPPADDIDWADVSPAGARRFLSRALRLAREVSSAPGTDAASGDAELRRTTHRILDEVTGMLEGHRFNVVVARLMTLVAAARKAVDAGAAHDPAVREAAEVAAVTLSLFAPYTAEEMWHRLGHRPTVARAGWPAADPSLVEQRHVACVVQVAGRKRAVLSVRPSISEHELGRKALADPAVVRALDGRDVARLVVRPPSVVNVVPGG